MALGSAADEADRVGSRTIVQQRDWRPSSSGVAEMKSHLVAPAMREAAGTQRAVGVDYEGF